MARPREDRGTYVKARDYWCNIVQPGQRMTSRDLYEAIGIELNPDTVEPRKTVSSFLCLAVKDGLALHVGRKDHMKLYERPYIEDYDALVEDEEKQHICFKCNKQFTPSEVGEGVLALFSKMSRMLDAAHAKSREAARDHQQLVTEVKNLKELIDEKDRKILSLNKAISSGAKGMDLHALAQFRNHLPNQKEASK